MKAGLFGYGVVGSGIYEFLVRDDMHDINVSRVLDRRRRPEIETIYTDDVSDIINDKSIDTVIEVLGGFEPAHQFALRAVKAGKNLITANKLMLAENYAEIMRTAREKGVSVAFSATVGGGIPYLKNLALVSRADTVIEVGGIMNGTTNYILDEMQSHGADFEEVLKSAQEQGYAEGDPSADIDAIDLRCKLALVCDTGFNSCCTASDIPSFGVRCITKKDIDIFKANGLRCRLIARAVRNGSGVTAYCEPTLFAAGSSEFSVYGIENYIYYIGERTGKHGFSGLGAGRKTTAVNVYLDAIDIEGGHSPFDRIACEDTLTLDTESEVHRYYLRTKAVIPADLDIEVRFGEGIYLTEPVSIGRMHKMICPRLKHADPETFIAGWVK